MDQTIRPGKPDKQPPGLKNTIRKLDISNNLDRIVSVATFMGKLFIFLIQIIDYRF